MFVLDVDRITDTYKDTYATDTQGSGQSPPIAIPRLRLVSFPCIVLEGIYPVQEADVNTAKYSERRQLEHQTGEEDLFRKMNSEIC